MALAAGLLALIGVSQGFQSRVAQAPAGEDPFPFPHQSYKGSIPGMTDDGRWVNTKVGMEGFRDGEPTPATPDCDPACRDQTAFALPVGPKMEEAPICLEGIAQHLEAHLDTLRTGPLNEAYRHAIAVTGGCPEHGFGQFIHRDPCNPFVSVYAANDTVQNNRLRKLIDCHDAVEGETCFDAITWARDTGIKQDPQMYPGLYGMPEALQDFQDMFHQQSLHGCEKSCRGSEERARVLGHKWLKFINEVVKPDYMQEHIFTDYAKADMERSISVFCNRTIHPTSILS